MDNVLSEMVGSFARAPHKAFETGGPDCPALEWHVGPDKAFTFSRFCLAVAGRDYDFCPTGAAEASCYTDGMYDRGLDGVILTINGQIVTEPGQVESARTKMPGVTDVRILFLQTKMSDHIEAKDVSTFGAAVQAFMIDPLFLKNITTTPSVERVWSAFAAVRAACNGTFLPDVQLVFVYYGDWGNMGYPNVRQARRIQLANLRASLPSARVALDIMDGDGLVEAALRAGVAIERRIVVNQKMDFGSGSAAPGFVALVDGTALVDAFARPDLKTGARVIDERLFLDNPRHDRGNEEHRNAGAAALAESIANGGQTKIGLCHNGINIVVRELRAGATDKEIILVTPQIVNGCQSCHRLFELQNQLAGVELQMKVAVTGDERLKDEIVRGSNTQEGVGEYDMLSRNTMVRELEKEFERASPDKRLWLERRWNERALWHEEDPAFVIADDKVLTPRQLMDTFAATVLGVPHEAHGRAKIVLSRVSETGSDSKVHIFMREHEPTLYRAMGWIVHAGRRWGRSEKLPWNDGPDDAENQGFWARHHFSFALWRLADATPDIVGRRDLQRGGSAQRRFEILIDRLGDAGERDRLSATAAHALRRAEVGADSLSKSAAAKPRMPYGTRRNVSAQFRNLVKIEADAMRNSGKFAK
jgi:AIPR protein